MENTITITTEEYKQLLMSDIALGTLGCGIFNCVDRLGYDDKLRFDDGKLDTLLRAVTPTDYAACVAQLKEVEENE